MIIQVQTAATSDTSEPDRAGNAETFEEASRFLDMEVFERRSL
jgi:hypothetical protein